MSGSVIPLANAATGTLNGLSSDAEVRSDGTVTSGSATTASIGGYNGPQSCVVNMFQIPTAILADPTQQFSAAAYNIKLAWNPAAAFNVDLYGIGYSGSSSAVMASDYYEGTLDSANTLIQDNFLTTSTPNYTLVSASNTALVNYLNAQLNLARSDGASSAYVFFRLNPDAYHYSYRYQVGMNEYGGSYMPTLSYTTTSVAGWHTVPLGGGGFITGLAMHPSGNPIYCRTDCGGAYRWLPDTSSWVNLCDTMVSGTVANAASLMGISAITVDPNNTNKVYIAAGSTSAPTGVYASNDQGTTWSIIKSGNAMNPNGNFRATGERLAVDPNNSNILWFGTSQDGLQKGVFSSGTWRWTQVPSTSVPFGTVASGEKAGITFVACDRNGGSTIVYAGVYDSVGTTGGIYTTTDGTNWSKVGGVSFGAPSRAQVSANGTLYGTKWGKVVKLLRSGTLQDITPVASIAYTGVAVDPNDATGNTVFVAESDGSKQYNKIYRSTNGGSTWPSVQTTNFNNRVYTKTEPDGTRCCTGGWLSAVSSIMVNPANSNELWAGDFYGVLRTQDLQNFGTTNGCYWYGLQKNIEEVCVQSVKCAPTGAKLMTGISDVGGYRYLDINTRPYGAGGSTFSNPSGSSTIGLDFSESNNNVWARTWVTGAHGYGSGAVSSDGGVTWLKFGEITNKTVTNSGTAGLENWDVSTYLAKQKAKGATTVTLVVAGSNPTQSTNTLNFDSKEGTIAPRLIVNGTGNATLLADSYVLGGTANAATNYGSATSLSIQYAYGSGSYPQYTRWIYLKYDLSSVGAITSCTLQLNRQVSANTTPFTVGVFACTNTTWTESGITWNNRPAALSSTGDPQTSDPNYYDGATSLRGGRIAVSSTDPNLMVWMPEVRGTAPRYSNDRGVSWTACTGAPTSQMGSQFDPGEIIQQLASDRVNGKFYAVNFGGNHTVYSSTNGGATFAVTGTCPTGSYNLYRAQIVAAPAANDVWISDDGSCTIPAGGGIWRSTNGGATWVKVANGVIKQVSQVTFGKAQSGTGYTVFINGYKNGVQGIYRSDDYGTTWVQLTVSPTLAPIKVLTGDRQNYGHVYIGTGGRGVFHGQ